MGTFNESDQNRWPGSIPRGVVAGFLAGAGLLAGAVSALALVAGGYAPTVTAPAAGGPALPDAGPPTLARAPLLVLPASTSSRGGIAVGYPHSIQGAIAAATSFAETFDSVDVGGARNWARSVAAPASVGTVVDRVSAGVAAIRAAWGLPSSGLGVGSFVAYQVRAYQVHAAGRDRVVVWLLATQSSSIGAAAPTERPAVLGFPLVWTAADWRLTDQTPRPAPAADSPGTGQAFARGWRDLAEGVRSTPTLGATGPATAPVRAGSVPVAASAAWVRSAATVAGPSTQRCPGGVVGLICYGLGLAAGPMGVSTSPAGAVPGVVGGLVGNTLGALAAGFGQSASDLLHQLAAVFITSSTIGLSGAGVDSLVSITTPIAALVAALLVIASAGSTAWKHDGSPLATSLVGLARAGLICVALVAVVQVCLRASDELSAWIVTRSFGSNQGLTDRLGGALTAMDTISPPLVLLVAGLAIVLVMALWAEMVLRHLAVVLLVATAPIAAAGLVCTATAAWWPRARSALIQLIVLKPVIILCLAVGFGEFGAARDFNAVMAALITLAAAVFAWPMLAKFMTFTTAGAGAGLVAALGGSLGAVAVGRLAPRPGSGPGEAPGPAYAVAAERQSDSMMGSRRATAAPGGAGGVGAATFVAAQAGGAFAGHVRAGIDAMAEHCDLGPDPSGGFMQGLAPPPGGQRGGDR